MYPFSPRRYDDESYEVFALRRWTENRLFKLLEQETIVYPSRHIKDRHGNNLPYRKKDHPDECH